MRSRVEYEKKVFLTAGPSPMLKMCFVLNSSEHEISTAYKKAKMQKIKDQRYFFLKYVHVTLMCYIYSANKCYYVSNCKLSQRKKGFIASGSVSELAGFGFNISYLYFVHITNI